MAGDEGTTEGQRDFTPEERRLLDWAAKAHGEGGQAWAEENARLILDQARAMGYL
jgi:hypothetical protein